MVIGLASDAGDTVVQVAPPSVEYSYEVRCDDMQLGAVTYTASDPLPGTIVEMEGAVSARPPSVMTQLIGALANLIRAGSASHEYLCSPQPNGTADLRALPDHAFNNLS
ncbi:unannotated protein [freshwater metagenome]|uniref:Unannotated protein n=1 Tax=freshwater metagenome TaxID=449393 RepID=A0A6J7FP86_9ZZZZ